MSDDIEFLEGVWGNSERSAIQSNARVLDRVEKRVTELESKLVQQADEIVELRSMVLGLGALLKRRLDYQAGDLEQEVKIAYEQLMPPAPVMAMATDPYRGLPLDERVDDSEAKRLIAQAQDHHFSKEFAEARVIYQDIVERFPGSKQAVTADQQIKNLKGL